MSTGWVRSTDRVSTECGGWAQSTMGVNTVHLEGAARITMKIKRWLLAAILTKGENGVTEAMLFLFIVSGELNMEYQRSEHGIPAEEQVVPGKIITLMKKSARSTRENSTEYRASKDGRNVFLK